MSWPANHLPKYRKHRASGQAVVTLSGRGHYLGPHGTKASRELYDRLIAEWLQQHRQPSPDSADAITVVELCDRYLRFARGYYQKDGRCTKATPGVKACIKYLRDWYGREPASNFGSIALTLTRDPDSRLGYAASSYSTPRRISPTARRGARSMVQQPPNEPAVVAAWCCVICIAFASGFAGAPSFALKPDYFDAHQTRSDFPGIPTKRVICDYSRGDGYN